MARTKKWSEKEIEIIFLEICEKIANSKNGIVQILKSDERYPAMDTFFRWKRFSSERNKIYLEAKDTQGHAFADEINEIAKELDNLGLENDPNLISANTRRLVALQNSRAWQAKYFSPRQFGDNNTIELEKIKEALEERLGGGMNGNNI